MTEKNIENRCRRQLARTGDNIGDYMIVDNSKGFYVVEGCNGISSYMLTLADVVGWINNSRGVSAVNRNEVSMLEKELASKIQLMGNGGFYTSADALRDYMHLFLDKKLLFSLIMDVYVNDGNNFPRSIIVKAKSLAKEIPEDERLQGLPKGNTITVYRADKSSDMSMRNVVKSATSWTINKNVAIWFAYRYAGKQEPRLIWKAEIERDKVIAYLQSRNEDEVLQYRAVKKLEILPQPTDEEVEEAFKEKKRRSCEALEGLNEWAKANGLHEVPKEMFA